MVCHQTYQGESGEWLFPEEVETSEDGRIVDQAGRPVTAGRHEKMSKSKKNVVGLDAIVDTYGADTARLYLLSDSPPERDLEWTETGIEGIWRYVNRLWRMVSEPPVPLPPSGGRIPPFLSAEVATVRRTTHKTIAAVTDDLDKFRFNRAVARIRELTNALEELPVDAPAAEYALREGLETLAKLLGPMMPHLAEEMWETLGGSGLLADQPWPKADLDLTRDEQVTIAVQVNGKFRGTFETVRDSDAQSVESTALALPQVARCLEGKSAAQNRRRAKPDRQHRRVRTPSLNGRGLLRGAIAGVALALASCGWAPLNADMEAGPAAEELRAIRVDPIPERLGQRLRMALRNSFNPSGEPARQRYILRVAPLVGLSNLGIQAQGLGTLGQLDISVTYSLIDMESGKILLTNTIHVANSFDLNPNQYSTVVGEDDAAVRSVVELNQEIVTRLTLFMQRRIAEKSSKPS
jgi:leucyl-tRNA synthetase